MSEGSRKRRVDSRTRDTRERNEQEIAEDQNRSAKAANKVLAWVAFIGIQIIAFWYINSTQQNQSFASVDTRVSRKFVEIPCSSDYDGEKTAYKECVPTRCGRGVSDTIISKDEASVLHRMASKGLSYGGSSGGASILDLHSGALSMEDKFVNIYKILDDESNTVWTEYEFEVYREVKQRIKETIAKEFGVSTDHMHLTSPTFFSRINEQPAYTVHDEYWHVHIDKEQYGSFQYTSLVYLSNYKTDFEGGRFIFTGPNSNATIEPKLGRISFFTSGSENPHHVERVTRGTRYALTVAFTCDKKKAIKDPVLKKS